jgi:hypothetical protein
VTVGNQDAAEPMMGNTLGDIQREVQQVLDLNIDRAVKVHVMSFIAERDDGQQENISLSAAGCLLADFRDEEIVRIEWKVMAMILHRADGQYDYGLTLRNFT